MSNLIDVRCFRAGRGRDSRFLTGTFESVAWRYNWCSEKLKLVVMQSIALITLLVLLIMLGQRAMDLNRAGGPDGGLLGGVLAGTVVMLLGSGYLLWLAIRRLLVLRLEQRELASMADRPVG